MASNINPDQINEAFPVAGQDNPSQGFRDNFSATKNNLNTAKSEITDLQTNTAKLNASNNFQSNELSGALLIGNKVKVFAGGTVSSSQDINLSNGHYQKFTCSAILTLTFNEWSSTTNHQDIVYVELLSNDSNSKDITFATVAGGTFKVQEGYTNPVTLNNSTDPLIYKFWSYDGGLTVYMQYVGKFI